MRIEKPEVTREERHRAGQEGTAPALAVEAVVAALAAGLGVPQHLLHLGAVDELGGQHAPGVVGPGDRLTVGAERLVDHAEGVAAVQFAVKVDVAREQLDHLDRDLVAQPRFVGGREQRRLDRAASDTHLRVELGQLAVGAPLVAVARDRQSREMRVRQLGAGRREAGHQFQRVAVAAHAGLHLLAGPSFEQASRVVVGAHEGGQLRIEHAEPAQQASTLSLARVWSARDSTMSYDASASN